MTVYTVLLMPETKGVNLVALERRLTKSNPLVELDVKIAPSGALETKQ